VLSFPVHAQRAYRHHQAEVRMRDLIAEEEAAGRLQDERAAARAAADKEKRAKKKERKKAKKVGRVGRCCCWCMRLQCQIRRPWQL
jgi:septal ring factor EnvC (AmiA/AmiB activator)